MTASGPSTGSVARVVDGDTLEIARDSGNDRVRLVGIDAPETGECLADVSRDELARLVDGRPVELSADRSDRDRYGRLLRYVRANGIDVNAELVRRGLALSRPYPPDTTHQQTLDAAQSDARSAGVGIWAPDACGPASSAKMTISAITPDPPGDDSTNLNGETVQITNAGRRPTDLTGWVLRDESASKRFAFPAGFVLDPSSSVEVHSGCGADDDSDLYWCESGSAIWNNSGDTAFLLDPAGNIHTSHHYG